MGAGKSTVSKKFEELGALVIDADQLSRQALEPVGEAYRGAVELFGPAILYEDQRINRQKLASLVFSDEQARLSLEALVHPVVAAKREAILARCGHDQFVIEEIPLLVEKGLADHYQKVIVVQAPEEVRLARLESNRGLSRAEARARINSQVTDEQRMAVADFVVDNSGDEASLDAQVREIWERLQQPARQ